MLADSDFTRKSGELGTNMFSKPGRRTIFQYLCFSDKPAAPTERPTTFQAKPRQSSQVDDFMDAMTKQRFKEGAIKKEKDRVKKAAAAEKGLALGSRGKGAKSQQGVYSAAIMEDPII